MKKLILVILTFYFSLFIVRTFSQPCLPEGITFTSQGQVDNFQTNYPNCTEIEGDVLVMGYIINLNGLVTLNSIQGHLNIQGTNLSNLEGLDNLQYVGGNLSLQFNQYLSDYSSLQNLIEIGGSLAIEDGPSEDLYGFNSLTTVGSTVSLSGNSNLNSLSGLENLNSIGGNLAISITPQLNELSGLSNLTSIGNDLIICYNLSLTNLTGLTSLSSIGGNFRIYGNHSMLNLIGLNNLNSINGSIKIYENNSFINLAGIENIDPGSIIDLLIFNNPILSSCELQSICDYLTSPGGEILIFDNAPGCNNMIEIEEACDGVSIKEFVSENTSEISPNPCFEVMNVQYTMAEAGFFMLSIINTTGTEVKTVTTNESIPGTYEMEIDLRNHPSGLYFLLIKTNDGIQTKKIIKFD